MASDGVFRAPALEAYIRGRCSCRKGGDKLPGPDCNERLRKIHRLEARLAAERSKVRHYRDRITELRKRLAELESAPESG